MANHAEHMFARCIDALEAGYWQTGMELYSWRYHPKRSNISKVKFTALPLPFIERGSLARFKGKKVLVINEQGFGDEIMFFRSMHYLMEVAQSIAWMAYPETVELLKLNAPPQVQFLTGRSLDKEYLSQFDCWTTSGTLFSIIGQKAPPLLKHYFTTGQHIEPEPDTVGVCWMANAASPNKALRSVDITKLESLLDDAKCITSLTMGAQEPSWMQPCPPFADFLETAKFIQGLSTVLTIDTGVAHVAGALGKSTLLMVKDHFDWRWRYQQNGCSILYPSIKVMRFDDLVSY